MAKCCAKTMEKEKPGKELELEVKVAEVIDYMRITGTYLPLLREVIIRKLVEKAANEKKIKISDAELQKGADTFRIMHGLYKKETMNKWLDSTGITVEKFENYIETNLLMSKLKDELFKKAGKDKLSDNSAVNDLMREIAYNQWLEKALK